MRLRGVLLTVITTALLTPVFAPTLTASAAGSSSPAVRTSIPRCSNLVVAASTTEGAGGTGGLVLLFANVGSRCVVGGFPRIVFFNSQGNEIDTRDVHSSSMFYAEPKPRSITIGHDGVASVGLSWQDNPVNSQTCPRAAWATVTLSSGGRQITGSPAVSASPCGGYVFVTPLEAGPKPSPNG